MKKILVVDWILVFTFILSAGSGVMLHIAGHYYDHETWHNWAVSHILTTSLFLIAAFLM